MNVELPTDVRLVALVARLLDVHDARRARGVPVVGIVDPVVQAHAGFHLALALRVLEALYELELEAGPGLAAVGQLMTRLAPDFPGLTPADVEFVVAYLAHGREVHALGADGVVATREATQLLRFDRRMGAVMLSENARAFIRLVSLGRDWLYEDKNIEVIGRAIELGRFGEVPAQCRMVIAHLSAANLQLTAIEERPGQDERAEILIAESAAYRKMLNDSETAVRAAIALLRDDSVQLAFERWAEVQSDDLRFADLVGWVEAVGQAVEGLSRHFVAFLDRSQRTPRRAAGVPAFDRLATRLVAEPVDIDALKAALELVMPTKLAAGAFHPVDFIDAADLAGGAGPAQPIVIELGSGIVPRSRFEEFLRRHRAWVLARLRQGPLALRDLIERPDFPLAAGETVSDFFGFYTLPDDLGAGEVRIAVGLPPEGMLVRTDAAVIHGSNPTLFIMGGAHDA